MGYCEVSDTNWCVDSVVLVRYVLDLPVPRWELRAELWRKLLPPQVPVAADIDYTQLGRR